MRAPGCSRRSRRRPLSVAVRAGPGGTPRTGRCPGCLERARRRRRAPDGSRPDRAGDAGPEPAWWRVPPATPRRCRGPGGGDRATHALDDLDQRQHRRLWRACGRRVPERGRRCAWRGGDGADLEPAAVVDRAARRRAPRGGRPGPRGRRRPGRRRRGPASRGRGPRRGRSWRSVEPTERREQVGPHEGDRAGDVEHVAHGVVLGLVELAPLDVVRRAGRTGRRPCRPTAGGRLVGPLDDLRARRCRRSSGRPPRPAAAPRRGRGARRRGRTGGRPRPARRRAPRWRRRRTPGRCRGAAGGRRAARRRSDRAGPRHRRWRCR